MERNSRPSFLTMRPRCGLVRYDSILRSEHGKRCTANRSDEGSNRFVIQGPESSNSAYQQFHGNCGPDGRLNTAISFLYASVPCYPLPTGSSISSARSVAFYEAVDAEHARNWLRNALGH